MMESLGIWLGGGGYIKFHYDLTPKKPAPQRVRFQSMKKKGKTVQGMLFTTILQVVLSSLAVFAKKIIQKTETSHEIVAV